MLFQLFFQVKQPAADAEKPLLSQEQIASALDRLTGPAADRTLRARTSRTEPTVRVVQGNSIVRVEATDSSQLFFDGIKIEVGGIATTLPKKFYYNRDGSFVDACSPCALPLPAPPPAANNNSLGGAAETLGLIAQAREQQTATEKQNKPTEAQGAVLIKLLMDRLGPR